MFLWFFILFLKANAVALLAGVTAALIAVGAVIYGSTLDRRLASTCSTVSCWILILWKYLEYFQNFIFIFQLNTITSGVLNAVPAVTNADCPIVAAGNPTNAEILACVNAAVTDINTNIITAINAYGNPTCT